MSEHKTTLVFAIAICCSLPLASCVSNANGVKFNQLPQKQLERGEARVHFFRDKAFYVMQAPYIVTANVVVDGRPVGGLKNGGFLTLTIPAGQHSFTVWSGSDRRDNSDFPCPCYTDWNLDIPAGNDAYFQIWDKTRMEGARATGGLAAGATVGGVGGAIDSVASGSDIRIGAISGAITGGAHGMVTGFRGRVREGESRIWAVDLVGEPDAVLLLNNLCQDQTAP